MMDNKDEVNQEVTKEGQDLIVKNFESIINTLDPYNERPGLLKTPQRAAKAMEFFCSGYRMNLDEIINDAIFPADGHNDIVLVKNIEIASTCEHHLLPFYGTCHIGYIPNGQILGLSKFARLCEVFGRRFQVQERLNRQIADCIFERLEPLGVMVVTDCVHTCMKLRGIQEPCSSTVIQTKLGQFAEDPQLIAEFYRLLALENHRQ